MKIAMVSSESNPLFKSGGLGDVVYSLSKELVKLKQEVIIILPYYQVIKNRRFENIKYVTSFDVFITNHSSGVNVFEMEYEGIKFYLLENQQYFERYNVYGEWDDPERFAFFTLAARTLFFAVNFKPDVIHVHDWQPAMLPTLIKTQNKDDELFKDSKFVLTIHNPAFQGYFSSDRLYDFYHLDYSLYTNGDVRFKDQVSTLKAGIMYSDLITTVSNTHHFELLTPEGSMGLNEVIKFRAGDFIGIENGIDTLEFNPLKDKDITSRFNSKNILEGKLKNKEYILKRFNLKDNSAPLFALVSRLTWQKGTDILLPAIEKLLYEGRNVIVLGSGESNVENHLNYLKGKYPDHFGLYIGYNDALAHQIYAGSDFFLMPSRFEPCGIGQMIAQRYASLPIVRFTGGLKDTVIGYDETNLSTADGFGFYNFDFNEFVSVLNLALKVYHITGVFNQLRLNAFKKDHSWKRSASLYLKAYKEIKGR